MAKTNLSQLKNWFKNGLKPPQEHFWNWMDSFWHKDEKIPMSTIFELEEALNEKANADHTHTDFAKKDASNLLPEDVIAWKAALYDNEDGDLFDADILLTDAYPGLSIPAESTQKDFNDVISAEVEALKEIDETPYMTINSANEVTADWAARMTNFLDLIAIKFENNQRFVITKQSSFDMGWKMIFGDSNIEFKSYEDTGGGHYDWVSKGVYLRTINGENSTDGNIVLNDANLLTSKNFTDLLIDEDEPLTNLFDAIILKLGTLSSAVQNGIKTPTGINCSTNPNYPSSEKGDSYKVTAAGKIGGASGPAVEVGDMIICTANNAGGTHASVGANFFIVQTNLDQATESTVGYAKIATNAQTDTGSDDTTIITPKKMKRGLDAKTEATLNLTQSYASFGLTAANSQKEFNEAVANESTIQTTIIPLTAFDEDIEDSTDYSGISYYPSEEKILDLKAVSEIAPTGASIKLSVSKNDTFIGVSNPFLEIPISGRISTGTHDIVNTDLAVGDRLRFYCNQKGSSEPGKGVQIIMKTQKIV